VTRRDGKLSQLLRDEKKWGEIHRFIAAEIARLGGRRGAKTAAVSAAVERFNIEPRGIEKILKHFAAWEPASRGVKAIVDAVMPRIDADLHLVRENLSPEDIEQLKDADLSLAVRLAQSSKKITVQK
jgi:hypothetical protein